MCIRYTYPGAILLCKYKAANPVKPANMGLYIGASGLTLAATKQAYEKIISAYTDGTIIYASPIELSCHPQRGAGGWIF